MRETTQRLTRSVDLAKVWTSAISIDRDRVLVIEDWLLAAASDVPRARREWDEGGLTLLRCGDLFTAIRLPEDSVRAAASSSDPAEVNTYLAKVLDGGPVIASRSRYYALVPPSTGVAWQHPDAECLTWGTWLGVPPVPRTSCEDSPAYWAVPMSGPGKLCDADAVSQLVRLARQLLSGQEAGDGS
ncbi:hypothetical protein GCM10023086_22310 [Streptomyces venetus]|uniref:DNA primase/polymerase bifunctional N-terminal domain-containing protein n=1 Tax=Streptomyces venetus TaxID=1701086 RepID=A0ABP8FJA7_9ACTN